ncbi:hypothetical protein BT67DRAFT_134653 [Trichocladium antarcticum]|uniref:Uncharacterized protein n=1 Tax=Trichocladium antarcticum TaxID=1450529 RepID=A0AAN6UFK2_9PEZI|nr:hypothetical protein BT67DRAFT_134653 [Trichocladium antarcticum]
MVCLGQNTHRDVSELDSIKQSRYNRSLKIRWHFWTRASIASQPSWPKLCGWVCVVVVWSSSIFSCEDTVSQRHETPKVSP